MRYIFYLSPYSLDDLLFQSDTDLFQIPDIDYINLKLNSIGLLKISYFMGG